MQEVPRGACCSGAAGAPWEEQEAGKPQTQLTSDPNEARRLSKHTKPGEQGAGPDGEGRMQACPGVARAPPRVGATEAPEDH